MLLPLLLLLLLLLLLAGTCVPAALAALRV
jgi:hypothetical protein